ncbi:FkbM family methyltransferase [Pseudotabrizicola algicola]|uniref:FkbM family methyltransferase n=1 Tax=Pseudotabrizicola algicola TaxID=2709381 RepID=A0A6B3RG82_9RHOB|nr:FkbM family methyltransferase [Pseudotabrizicola algicola]NEX44987.1 FkbM family methyltransferase [Pseudotabrizicola algicola]
MQAKRVLGVVATPVAEEVPDQTAALSAKLDQMIRLTEESLHLQRVALLEAGHILRFHAGITPVALSLPDAQEDFVQRTVLRTRQFYEAKLLAAVQELGLITATTTVCDIGANIGNASVFFGKVLGAKRVLAFEPLPHAYTTLCRNLELNGLTDALAYSCMVGATSGRGDLARFNPRNLGATSFVAAKAGPIPMVALDDLIEAEELQGLGFIKIDVEGMHMDVLSGAKKVIKAFKPAIWIGLSNHNADYAACAKMLEGLGYGAQRIGPNDHVFKPKK